ncbi:MAG TPA: hypothetical protein VFT06_10565 [Flavisolibacter sp.]|nr:hypothetical protein [Flavisolibacter sp.]
MSQNNRMQFGIWMDTHHATVVGRARPDASDVSVLGSAGNAGATPTSSEKNEHNDEKTLQHKF